MNAKKQYKAYLNWFHNHCSGWFPYEFSEWKFLYWNEIKNKKGA
jgi:hypothetical protein